MDIKIEKKKAFKVAGIKSDVTKSSNFPKVWDRLVEKVPREKFEEFGNGQIFGVGYDYIMDEEDSFIYLAGFDLTDEVKAEELGLDILSISEKEYAIVSLQGPIPKCIHEVGSILFHISSLKKDIDMMKVPILKYMEMETLIQKIIKWNYGFL